MAVVAEVVETGSRQRLLLALGCDRAQGYHFGAAGSPEAIEQLVVGPEPVSPCQRPTQSVRRVADASRRVFDRDPVTAAATDRTVDDSAVRGAPPGGQGESARHASSAVHRARNLGPGALPLA